MGRNKEQRLKTVEIGTAEVSGLSDEQDLKRMSFSLYSTPSPLSSQRQSVVMQSPCPELSRQGKRPPLDQAFCQVLFPSVLLNQAPTDTSRKQLENLEAEQ